MLKIIKMLNFYVNSSGLNRRLLGTMNLITLIPHRGAPRASSHLTLDFVVPCPLNLPSQQTKDIFGQTQAG